MTDSVHLEEGRHYKRHLTTGLILGVFVFSTIYLEVSLLDLLIRFPRFIGFFFDRFLPPRFDRLFQYTPLIIETILFAVVATYISSVLSFLIGLSMSEFYNPFPWLRAVARFVVSFFRNIPILVLAQLLVFVFGIGRMVGLIALILATLGFLARAYAESINEIGAEKLEGIQATGATRAQVLVHALVPAFVPAWLNWTLFIFEINIRASVLLGLVGAGGIGIMIRSNINLFRFREAMVIILAVLVLVIATETITNAIRKALR